MNNNQIGTWIIRIFPWAGLVVLLAHLPGLLLRRSDQPQVFGQYSTNYFFLLICYLLLVLILFGIGMYLIKAEKAKRFVAIYDQYNLQNWSILFTLLLWGGWAFLRELLSNFEQPFGWLLVLFSLACIFLYKFDEKVKQRLEFLIKENSINIIDFVFIVFISLISILCFFGYWRNINSFIFLSSDSANISAFIAGRKFPEIFQGDALLSDIDNYRLYLTIHIPLVGWLGDLVGNLGLAWAYLFPFHIFIQAIGFYLLGFALFRSRYWAMLFSLITLAPVGISFGEFWGIPNDIVPRMSFQAILPFLLALNLFWRDKPYRWGWLMLLMGILVYVHPVSTPAWGLGVWASLWILLPANWSLKRRIRFMAFLAIIFVITVAPFALHYLKYFAHGEIANYDEVYTVMESRYREGYLDLSVGLLEYLSVVVRQDFLLVVLALAGVIVNLFLPHADEERKKMKITLVWLGGLLFVSIILPLMDHNIARALGKLPLQVDLIRGLRYVFPLLLAFALYLFWILNEHPAIKEKFFRFPVRRATLLLGFVFCLNWIVKHPVHSFTTAVECWSSRHFYCPLDKNELSKIEVLDAIKNKTNEDAVILPSSLPLETRYYALRSVAFAYKDGGILGYSNPDGLLEWYAVSQIYQDIMAESDLDARTGEFIELARNLDADYVLVDWKVNQKLLEKSNSDVIFQNKRFSLLSVLAR